jgi:predicted RNA-binding Zn-ribbon protein involved in translation (DUF1610 family)
MYMPIYNAQNTISDDVFNKFTEIKPTTVDSAVDICTECGITMTLDGSDYVCSKCGTIEQSAVAPSNEESTNNYVRVSMNGKKGTFYNVISDYSKTQKTVIFNQLMQNNNAYSGFKFSRDVLSKVADRYNGIQKTLLDEYMPDGSVKQKKFVRRGYIKDEVLAALIYYECIRAKSARKKRDIAVMMKLPTNGFSNGENILRDLHNKGKISIPIDDEPYADYLDRYLEALNIDNDKYKGFILEVIEKSEKLHIGMNSQISSKIVGALWLVITNCKLDISAAALEKSADGIKKSTFIKFYNILNSQKILFLSIFNKYEIPLN